MSPSQAEGGPGRDGNVIMTVDEALALAIFSHRAGRFAEAAVIYRQILSLAPDNVDALHFLGLAEHQAGRPELALRYLDRALALAPEHADALRCRGDVHRGLGHLDAAEADYRQALARRPDDPNTLGHLGTVLRARGDGEGAVAALRAALARNPDRASTWRNLGATLADMHRGQEAVVAYREAARLAPGSAGTFCDLGIALHLDGRLPEAIAMYRQGLALAPRDARSRYLLAASTGEGVPTRAPDDYVRAEFDRFAAMFDTKLASLEYRGPALIRDAAREIISQLPARPAVLDAGCGTGLCAPLLRPLAGSLVGVDLSPAMIDKARRRKLYDGLVVAELTAYLRAHRGCQDLIVSADTLVYFGDLADVIAAAAAALRAGGVLLFTLERAPPAEAPTGWKLYPHGRFGHTRDHAAWVLAAAGLADPLIREITSRKEAGRWVPGWLVRARRPAG